MTIIRSYVFAGALSFLGVFTVAPTALAYTQAEMANTASFSQAANYYDSLVSWFNWQAEASEEAAANDEGESNEATNLFYAYYYAALAQENTYYAFYYAPSGSYAENYAYKAYLNSYQRYLVAYYCYLGYYSYEGSPEENYAQQAQNYLGLSMYYAAIGA